ncbi:AAA family ATPase [Prosthecobacter sp. SYSU 5D2]|uniref:AAA family ATPase n=1 Tax=Prosthecobacter sp. SYSU 5D2 TaxID=3134134 RepID=UPI0031FEDA84
MRLHAITLRNYRRHQELRVELDAERTLIGGANESGKSTLVEAVHRALFLKAKGNSEVHRRMTSLTYAGKPEVEVEFEAGAKRYHLVKCFKGASGTVRLTEAGGGSWQGDEAEERLAQLLKIGAGGRKPQEQWGHLWVWQGSSAHDPLTQAEAERDSLVQRLQSQGGAAVIQSALDTKVAGYFAAQVEAVFHKTSGEAKKGSDYGQAIQAEKEAKEVEERARGVLENLQQAVMQHEQASRQMEEAEEALKMMEGQRVALEERAVQVAGLKREEENQARLAEEARRAYEERLLAEQKVSELRSALAAKQAAAAPQREDLGRFETRLAEAQREAAEAEEKYVEAETRHRSARSLAELAQALATVEEKIRGHDRLRERDRQMQALTAQKTNLETQLAALPPVDAGAVKQLQDLEKALGQAQAVLDSVATGIEVLTSDADIRLGQEALATGEKRTLTAETELRIGGSRLRILPGGGTSLAQARKKELDTRRVMEDAFARLGLKSLEEAGEVLARRGQVQGEIKARLAELKGLGAEKIPAELKAASRELAAARAEAERRRETCEESSPALAEAQKILAEAERDQQASRMQRDQCAAALKKAEAALTAQAESMRKTEQEMMELEIHLKVLLEREGDDAARALAVQQRLAQKTSAEAALAGTRQALEKLQPQFLDAEQAQYDRAWKAQSDKKSSAHEKRIAAAAMLRSDGSNDPEAALALACARSQAAQAHREAAGRQAEALRRVHQLILEEQQKLADQFTRPLADRVEGYLQRLFGPDVLVQVSLQGNAFEKLTVSRAGQSAFDFDSLSNGAKEQVAAAFRLALAEILAEAHDGCLPVVFDDAFAHSDPDRVQHLQRMLDLAATRGLQIILLTCTPADYAMLGAKEIRL